ncbi:GTP 3',8-cyclase MoaA [Lacrimispora indolis]|uniref:GTP 3',8-cyclase MoaA n=1 Tax=Lacrimispora indolis TaxID=69825 RepID=UPI00045EAF60|nr:GTP 3',8-cyclase MoaA [Lacrimispora indolis]MBE7718790.1 GTP 3',8-cyclase MoaA [Lacrimispora celerecrescens]
MKDSCNRTIDYIRISVTDRCNLRCLYCMPEEGVVPMRHEDILTYGEIVRICEAGARLGIRKVKVTGGEPLVRKDIEVLIKELTAIPGIQDVTMTTNGCLLKEKAAALKSAGLSSVNVSLDTLDPVRFAKITRRDSFESVVEGIESALAAGLKVKINCAVMEELTKEDVLAFARFSMERRIPVRFIEMMPIGQGKNYKAMENDDLAEILSEAFGELRESREVKGNGPAVYYTWGEGAGFVGFISAVSHKFCGSCNRVRLTSDGFLKLCLDSPVGVDLKGPMRAGISDDSLFELMNQSIRNKPESHHFEEDCGETGLNMNQIGG